jgi:hypothetical protein
LDRLSIENTPFSAVSHALSFSCVNDTLYVVEDVVGILLLVLLLIVAVVVIAEMVDAYLAVLLSVATVALLDRSSAKELEIKNPGKINNKKTSESLRCASSDLLQPTAPADL